MTTLADVKPGDEVARLRELRLWRKVRDRTGLEMTLDQLRRIEAIIREDGA